MPDVERPIGTDLQLFNLFEGGRNRKGTAAIIAFRESRDTLKERRIGGRRLLNSTAGVSVRVDEAGSHHEIPGIDNSLRSCRRKVADPHDPIATNTDVGQDPRISRSIHNFTVPD